jgi:TatD DNase family protein
LISLFDSHCHLTDRSYLTNLDEIIQRAKDNGVLYILTVGLNIADSRASVKIAEKYQNVYCSVGIHPHESQKAQEADIKELQKLTASSKVKAVGETGLDFYRNYSDRSSQEKFFRLQIELAKSLNLPLIVHIRAAYPRAQAILKEHQYFSGVIHCYSGDENFACWAVDVGFYLSFTGVITYSNFKGQTLIKKLPKTKILIETDAPYLSPVPMRTRLNEPAFLKYTALALAQIKETTPEDIAYFTTQNCFELFHIREKI